MVVLMKDDMIRNCDNHAKDTLPHWVANSNGDDHANGMTIGRIAHTTKRNLCTDAEGYTYWEMNMLHT